MSPERRYSRPDDRLRRLGWLTAAGGLLWLCLIGRLVQVQGVRHQSYLARAREQHERQVELKAHRGRILDRRGRTLAVDIEAVSFYANPALVKEPLVVARHFATLNGPTAKTLARQLRGDGHFVYLARQLDEVALARAESRSFRGVFRIPETKRYYPQGSLAGQVLGYTNIDNQGSEGLEWAFEELLRESNGTALCQVDARGEAVPGSRQESQKPEDGSSVMLTIDAVYQDILEQELQEAIEDSEAEGGMGIISDPRTGEILAMANLPLYDPNDPGRAEARLRRNRTVTDPYEPGSTFKIMTMAAVLEEGDTRLDEKIDCGQGRLALSNGEVIRDHEAYDTLTVRQVVEHSSNIGIIKLARRLSRNRFYEYIRRFGCAIRTGVGLPGESSGLLEDVEQWSNRSQETIAIGQEISVTALQLVQGVGAIANGGLLMVPRIVKGIAHQDGKFETAPSLPPVRRVVSPSTAATLRQVLAGVVTNGTGKRAWIEGVSVAGKTGTAQRVAANGHGYDPDRNIVSFIGFLPAEDPELLCLVVIETPRKNRWGGHTAAPAFKRIMERILYLPEGRKITHQRRLDADDTRSMVIPDLRGMTGRVARFQAALRGLPVTFAGEGNVVVVQNPPPGANDRDLLQISCVLGDASQLAAVEVGDSLLRQAHLLQTLSRSRRSSSVGEL